MTFKFKIGDKVRITQSRNIFSRECDEKWSGKSLTYHNDFGEMEFLYTRSKITMTKK